MITKEQFTKFTSSEATNRFYVLLVVELQKAGLDTKLRTCAFLAEAFEESGCFRTTRENLNYGAQGLHDTWRAKFPTVEYATPYAHQPEKIANYVYGNRNGNNMLGDGWKYIGRGIFQNTGKNAYILLAKFLNIDCVNHPELLEEPLNAIRAAIWYWQTNNLSKYADAGKFESISKAINRGNPNSQYLAIHNDERNNYYNQLLKIWV